MSKVVLITGCSSGFGFITAKYLAEKGYTVVPTVRKKSDLRVLPNTKLLDVTWEQSRIDKTIAEIINEFGTVDVLISNAGYGHLGLVTDLTAADLRNQIETNFIGAFKVIRAVLPEMKKQKAGIIINISSILGLFSIPNYSAYAASKFALEALSQSLRSEIEKDGINVVVVNPGAFKTKFFAKSVSTSDANNIEDYGLDPLLVAKLIEKIMNTKKPKPNYLIGSEATAVRILRLLPSSLREPLLRKYLN